MNGTEELAGLLRRAAEKWPEKFTIEEDMLMVKAAPFPPMVDLNGLGWQYELTLDHMDAIAGAVGMEFDVRFYRDEKIWGARLWEVGSTCPRILMCDAPTKRAASLAALSACLKYALEAP